MKVILILSCLFWSVQSLAQDKFDNPKASFEELIDQLAENYIDKNMTKEDFYRLASQGLLEKLNKNHDWNQLLPPSKLKHLKEGLADSVVGIGVMIEFDKEAGNAVVLGSLPGSSSFAAGVQKGDRILRVNGQSFHKGNLKDMVYKIRGKIGTTVKLDILRNNEVIPLEFERRKLEIQSITAQQFDDTLLITIKQFNEGTVDRLKEILSSLKSSGVANVLFDMRNCSGGLFNATIDALDLIIPKGKLLSQVVDRHGDVKKYIAKEKGLSHPVKVAVLVNEKTSSGGELFSASLRSNLNARLIGMPTFGKWNAQTIHKLDNGFGFKFTTFIFQDPNGKSFEDTGLRPDIFVSFDGKEVEYLRFIKDNSKRLEKDIQLATALNLFQ